MPDPTRPTCKECVYFVASKDGRGKISGGTCHLRPPVPAIEGTFGYGRGGVHTAFRFPGVNEDSFCGEWEPSDTYLHQRGLERVDNYLDKHRRALGR